MNCPIDAIINAGNDLIRTRSVSLKWAPGRMRFSGVGFLERDFRDNISFDRDKIIS
jgi:hypothetical protein